MTHDGHAGTDAALIEDVQAAISEGAPERVVPTLEARARMPDDVVARLLLSRIRLMQGDYRRSRALVLEALSGSFDRPATALLLIGRLAGLGESSLLLQVCRQLPPELWPDAGSLVEIGHDLSALGAHGMAREYARAAVRLSPSDPEALFLLATLEHYFGQSEAVLELLKRCLAEDPAHAGAWWLYSRLRQPERREERIARLQSLARTASKRDAPYFWYALHNERHEAGEHEMAWAALEAGCAAMRGLVPYDRAMTEAMFAAIVAQPVPAPVSAGHHAQSVPRPIFVVGLHRSGTTLVERMLGGHHLISAAGETYEFPVQLKKATGLQFRGAMEAAAVAAAHSADLAAVGIGYLQEMRWRARGKPFVTDKLPSNFLNLGLICRALPTAVIVHVRRDPMDTLLSNLRTLFNLECAYSYDQTDFLHYHALYRDLMDHWRRALPADRLVELDYEAVVAAPERAASELAAALDLTAEPGMTRVDVGGDAVATASSVLLRDGIRRDRSGLWRRYQSWLASSAAAFGISG